MDKLVSYFSCEYCEFKRLSGFSLLPFGYNIAVKGIVYSSMHAQLNGLFYTVINYIPMNRVTGTRSFNTRKNTR